ncbi:hypothetical protein COW46_00570 [Candidatus Gracilibacteria bacterium CG17_big_fil_post_rev_8_21_14_2_50_48_13]|nr:MAG: hypothetical protein COW46_00570 [Candidatus Gracilibacteria bacterium CG17_big_fil_post_rev_8_21_14_2_50_48_13]
MEWLLAIVVLVAVLALWFVGVYNSLVAKRLSVEEQFSTIDTELKKRYDLIPNLVETVKGYASHEKEVFEKVTQARSQAMQAGNPEQRLAAENMLTQSLKSLFAVAENYPDLKANENFLQLQQTLSSVEEDINVSRQGYNAVVKDYMTTLQTFPTVLIAGLLGFGAKAFFEIPEQERENVQVKF